MTYYRCEEEQVDDDPEVSREWDRDKVPQKPGNPVKAKGTKKGIKKAVKRKTPKKK